MQLSRLSSEWKFPAGLEDCYAATQYCADQATFLNCSHDQIAIAGDSCGANLATAVCLLIKVCCSSEQHTETKRREDIAGPCCS